MSDEALAVVVAVIRNAEGLLYIQRRAPGSKYEGDWEFPGGKVERGEAPDDALRREIIEELRCGAVLVGDRVTTARCEKRDGRVFALSFYSVGVPIAALRPVSAEWGFVTDEAAWTLCPIDAAILNGAPFVRETRS